MTNRKTAGLFLVVTALLALSSTDVVAQDDTSDAGSKRRLLDGIVAVVGDQVVTRTELDEALTFQTLLLKAQLSAGRQQAEVDREFERLKAETRDNLVDNKLILMAAQESGLTVDEEVARRVQKLRDGFGDDEKLNQYLAGQGYSSIADYENQMKEEGLRQRVVFAQVRPKAEVVESEVEAEFVRVHGGKNIGGQECKGAVINYVELEQIWFPVAQNETYDVLVKAYTAGYACYLRVKKGGVPTESIAAECKHEGLVPRTGSLGEVDETRSFDRSFQEEFDKLKGRDKGSYSEPFIIPDGVRILQLTGRRSECVTDNTEIARLKDRLKARLSEDKFKKILKWWLKELRGKFRVDLKEL